MAMKWRGTAIAWPSASMMAQESEMCRTSAKQPCGMRWPPVTIRVRSRIACGYDGVTLIQLDGHCFGSVQRVNDSIAELRDIREQESERNS